MPAGAGAATNSQGSITMDEEAVRRWRCFGIRYFRDRL